MPAEMANYTSLSESPDDMQFWTDIARHRLTFQRCVTCGAVRHPPMPSCPWCASPAYEPVTSSGHGSIYSWVRVHVPFRDEFLQEVPYTIVTVDMAEGCRVFGRLSSDHGDRVLIGAPVEAQFVDHESWTECRFTLSEAVA